MAGVRDTEASFGVQVTGIEKLQQLSEQSDKTLSSLRKLDEAVNKGFNFSQSGNNSVAMINEQLGKAVGSAKRLDEAISKSGNGNAKSAEAAAKSTEALQRQYDITERNASQSARVAELKAKEAVSNDKVAISSEKVLQSQTRSAEMAARLSLQQEKVSSFTEKSALQQEKETVAIEKSVAAAEKLAAARQKDIALAEKYQAQTAAINSRGGGEMFSGGGGHGEKHENRITGAFKEAASLFGPGMLIASGVLRGAEGIKDLFKEGAHYNSEVSGMHGTWQTLTDGARDEGVSAHEAGNAQDIVRGIQDTSRTTGRSLDLVDEGYQQMYHATESADRTKHLVHSEMMVADAMNMSDAQASRFAMYGVGHSLDRGKVTGGAMNQMVQYAPALNSALTRAYLAETQHKKIEDVSEKDVEHEKKDLREHIKGSEISAKMLENALNYLGDVKFKEAAENAQKTIPGMVRTIKNGSGRIMGEFEKAFAEPISKHASDFFGGITKYILSTKSTDDARKLGSDLAVLTAKIGDAAGVAYNGFEKIWKATSNFRSGFADGFVKELTTIKNALEDGGKFISSVAKSVIDAMPKGLKDRSKELGEATGKVAAFFAVMKTASKLPVVGKVFDGMLGSIGKVIGKLPVVGGFLEKIIGGNKFKNDSAANKMLTASDQMLLAASKFSNGGGIGGGIGPNGKPLGYKTGRVVSGTGKFTIGQKLANSKLGSVLDKTFAKGAALADKGGIKGLIGKGIVGTYAGVSKAANYPSRMAKKFGATRLGKVLGGTGKFLGGAGRIGKSIFSRGGGAINAAFAGFDVYNAMKNNKSGTQGRHEGVGSAIGGGIGGTVGAALGSFVGPVGTVAGGIAGSWLGNKAGGFVGSHWSGMMKGGYKGIKSAQKWGDNTSEKLMGNPLTAGFGLALKGASHPIKSFDAMRSGADRLGKSLEALPFGKVANEGIRAFTHPIEGAKKLGEALVHPKKTFNDLYSGFKKNGHELSSMLTNPAKALQTLGKFGGALKKNFSGIKMPSFVSKLRQGVDNKAHNLLSYGAKNKDPLSFAGGMALTAASHPVRTFNEARNGIDGLGNKLAQSKSPIDIMGGIALKGIAHPIKALSAMRSGADRLGKSLKSLPFGDVMEQGIRAFTHPVEALKGFGQALSNPKKTINELGEGLKNNFVKGVEAIRHPQKAISDFGSSIKKNFSNIKLPSFLQKAFGGEKLKFPSFSGAAGNIGNSIKGGISTALKTLGLPDITNIKLPHIDLPKLPHIDNPFKDFKLPHIELPKLPKIENPFKGFKLPKIELPKLPHIENPFKGFKLPHVELPKLPKIENPFKDFKLPNITFPKLPKLENPFKDFKLPEISLPKLPKLDNPFKDFKLPHIELPKIPRIDNPFKDFKIPKIEIPKIPKLENPFKDFKFPKLPSWLEILKFFNVTKKEPSKGGSGGGSKKPKSIKPEGSGENPFKNWKIPHIEMPKMPKIDNPFKDFKLPHIEMPKMPKIDNPFKDFKLPHIEMPKIPKITNPFKDFKFPKIEFPKLPDWLEKLNPFGGAKSSAKGSGSAAKSAGKSISGTESSAKKAGNTVGSAFKGAFEKIKSGASNIGRDVGKSFGNIGKDAKSGIDKISSSMKSGMSKAKSSASNGAKDITKALKNSFKDIDSSAKTAFNKLSTGVKSGMNKAKSAAKSGAKNITSAVKSGLKSVSNAGKSEFNKLTSTVKSGMNKAKSSARSGAKNIGSAVKSGLKSVGNAGKSEFNKLTYTVKSGLNKSKNAARSGARGIGIAVKSGMRNFGNAGKSELNKLVSSIKSGLNKAKSAAKSGSSGIGNAVKSGLRNVGNAGKSEFSKLASNVTSGINKAKSAASSGAKSISETVKSGLSNVNSVAKTAMSGFSSAITSSMSKALSAAKSGASNLTNAVKDGLSKIGSAATEAMGRLTDATTSGMSKAAAAASSGANKISDSLKSGFDKAVSAASSASSKISASMSSIGNSASTATGQVNSLAAAINSLHSKTITITANVEGKGADKLENGTPGAFSAFNMVPAYANGTGASHNGGPALVNDAKGPNYREAYMLPNGFIGLFPKKRNILVDLPKGAHVLNGEDTKRKFGAGLSRYAKGTSGALQAIKDVRERKLAHTANVNTTQNVKKDTKVSVGKIEININDTTGNLKNNAKEIAKLVKAALEEELRKFNISNEEVGA